MGLDPRLNGVMAEAQRLHLVGPGELRSHIEHALGFLRALSPADDESGFVPVGARSSERDQCSGIGLDVDQRGVDAE